MKPSTALRIAIELIDKETRHLRQFFDMYQQGFESEKPGHDRYLKLKEAKETLEKLLDL